METVRFLGNVADIQPVLQFGDFLASYPDASLPGF